MSQAPDNDERRPPTKQAIEDARAYRAAITYLVERAEKRLAHSFDDDNREPMTMLALINAAWEMVKKYEVTDPDRFEGYKAVFMNAVGHLTGAIVEQVDLSQPVDDALTGAPDSETLRMAANFSPKKDDDGSVH